MILYRLYNIGEQFSAYAVANFSGRVFKVFWSELPTPWLDTKLRTLPLPRYLSGEEGMYRFAFTHEQLTRRVNILAQHPLEEVEWDCLRRIVVRLVDVPKRHVVVGEHQVLFREDAATFLPTSRPLDKLVPAA